jgi:hypothetical protein
VSRAKPGPSRLNYLPDGHNHCVAAITFNERKNKKIARADHMATIVLKGESSFIALTEYFHMETSVSQNYGPTRMLATKFFEHFFNALLMSAATGMVAIMNAHTPFSVLIRIVYARVIFPIAARTYTALPSRCNSLFGQKRRSLQGVPFGPIAELCVIPCAC